MSQKEIIAGCRKANLLVILAGVLLLGLYAAFEDLTSDGLRRTQAFLLLGYLIYPLFYGACHFLVWKLVTMYRSPNSFVCVDGKNLLVWTKTLPLREISSVSIKRGFLFDWLVIRLEDETETKVSSLALTRPIGDVAARVKAEAGVH